MLPRNINPENVCLQTVQPSSRAPEWPAKVKTKVGNTVFMNYRHELANDNSQGVLEILA
jgi:hypothetical protein